MKKPRRQFPRFRLDHLKSTLHFHIDVELIDISVSGLSIQSNKALRIGQEIEFRIKNENRFFDFLGKVTWCYLIRKELAPNGESLPIFKAGVRLKDPISKQGKSFSEFLDSHVPIQERFLYGRFNTGDGEPETIDNLEFLVKRLFPKGFIAECSNPGGTGKEFPVQLFAGLEVLDATVRIAHKKNIKGAQQMVQLGLEFTDVSTETQAILTKWFES